MDYKICRNCNARSDYNEKFCVRCGADITKSANYDIVSTNGGDAIYRIWSVSISKFLAMLLTGIFLVCVGMLASIQYEDMIKETTFGSKVVQIFGSDKGSVGTSIANNQVNSKQKKGSNKGKKKTKKAANKSKRNKKGFVLPKSNKKVYSEKKLKKLSSRKLAIARNEIFARHGYIFNNVSWKKYFKKKKWYSEKYDSNYFNNHSGEILNKYEKKNLKKIQKIEKER